MSGRSDKVISDGYFLSPNKHGTTCQLRPSINSKMVTTVNEGDDDARMTDGTKEKQSE